MTDEDEIAGTGKMTDILGVEFSSQATAFTQESSVTKAPFLFTTPHLQSSSETISVENTESIVESAVTKKEEPGSTTETLVIPSLSARTTVFTFTEDGPGDETPVIVTEGTAVTKVPLLSTTAPTVESSTAVSGVMQVTTVDSEVTEKGGLTAAVKPGTTLYPDMQGSGEQPTEDQEERKSITIPPTKEPYNKISVVTDEAETTETSAKTSVTSVMGSKTTFIPEYAATKATTLPRATQSDISLVELGSGDLTEEVPVANEVREDVGSGDQPDEIFPKVPAVTIAAPLVTSTVQLDYTLTTSSPVFDSSLTTHIETVEVTQTKTSITAAPLFSTDKEDTVKLTMEPELSEKTVNMTSTKDPTVRPSVDMSTIYFTSTVEDRSSGQTPIILTEESDLPTVSFLPSSPVLLEESTAIPSEVVSGEIKQTVKSEVTYMDGITPGVMVSIPPYPDMDGSGEQLTEDQQESSAEEISVPPTKESFFQITVVTDEAEITGTGKMTDVLGVEFSSQATAFTQESSVTKAPFLFTTLQLQSSLETISAENTESIVESEVTEKEEPGSTTETFVFPSLSARTTVFAFTEDGSGDETPVMFTEGTTVTKAPLLSTTAETVESSTAVSGVMQVTTVDIEVTEKEGLTAAVKPGTTLYPDMEGSGEQPTEDQEESSGEAITIPPTKEPYEKNRVVTDEAEITEKSAKTSVTLVVETTLIPESAVTKATTSPSTTQQDVSLLDFGSGDITEETPFGSDIREYESSGEQPNEIFTKKSLGTTVHLVTSTATLDYTLTTSSPSLDSSLTTHKDIVEFTKTKTSGTKTSFTSGREDIVELTMEPEVSEKTVDIKITEEPTVRPRLDMTTTYFTSVVEDRSSGKTPVILTEGSDLPAVSFLPSTAVLLEESTTMPSEFVSGEITQTVKSVLTHMEELTPGVMSSTPEYLDMDGSGEQLTEDQQEGSEEDITVPPTKESSDQIILMTDEDEIAGTEKMTDILGVEFSSQATAFTQESSVTKAPFLFTTPQLQSSLETISAENTESIVESEVTEKEEPGSTTETFVFPSLSARTTVFSFTEDGSGDETPVIFTEGTTVTKAPLLLSTAQTVESSTAVSGVMQVTTVERAVTEKEGLKPAVKPGTTLYPDMEEGERLTEDQEENSGEAITIEPTKEPYNKISVVTDEAEITEESEKTSVISVVETTLIPESAVTKAITSPSATQPDVSLVELSSGDITEETTVGSEVREDESSGEQPDEIFTKKSAVTTAPLVTSTAIHIDTVEVTKTSGTEASLFTSSKEETVEPDQPEGSSSGLGSGDFTEEIPAKDPIDESSGKHTEVFIKEPTVTTSPLLVSTVTMDYTVYQDVDKQHIFSPSSTSSQAKTSIDEFSPTTKPYHTGQATPPVLIFTEEGANEDELFSSVTESRKENLTSTKYFDSTAPELVSFIDGDSASLVEASSLFSTAILTEEAGRVTAVTLPPQAALITTEQPEGSGSDMTTTFTTHTMHVKYESTTQGLTPILIDTSEQVSSRITNITVEDKVKEDTVANTTVPLLSVNVSSEEKYLTSPTPVYTVHPDGDITQPDVAIYLGTTVSLRADSSSTHHPDVDQMFEQTISTTIMSTQPEMGLDRPLDGVTKHTGITESPPVSASRFTTMQSEAKLLTAGISKPGSMEKTPESELRSVESTSKRQRVEGEEGESVSPVMEMEEAVKPEGFTTPLSMTRTDAEAPVTSMTSGAVPVASIPTEDEEVDYDSSSSPSLLDAQPSSSEIESTLTPDLDLGHTIMGLVFDIPGTGVCT